MILVVDGEFKFKYEVVPAQHNRTKEVVKANLLSLSLREGTKDLGKLSQLHHTEKRKEGGHRNWRRSCKYGQLVQETSGSHGGIQQPVRD